MQKAIKVISSLIGLLILLAIVAIICLVTFVNPNDYKEQISAKVNAYTGRQLAINGEIKWSFFPWLGLQLNQVSLSNATGFGDKPFAQMNHADVKVQLVPLLKGNIEIGKLELDGLNLNLMKNAQGVSNWQDLTDHVKAQSDDNTTSDNNSTDIKSRKLNFNIEGINITNSNLTWQNKQNGQSVNLTQLKAQTGHFSLNKAFPLSLQFTVNSNQPAINGNFSLTSNVLGDPSSQVYNLQNLKLTSTLNNSSYANGKLNLALNGNVKVDLQKETLLVEAMNAKVANLQVQGNLQGQQILSNLQVQGKIQIPSFNLKQFLAALGNNLPSRQDPNALTKVSAAGDLQITDKTFALNQLTAQLDNTHINGNLAVTDFSKKALVFNLNLDQFNADNYMAVNASNNNTTNFSNQNTNQANPTNAQLSNAPLLPIDTLRSLDLQGQLKIDNLQLKKLNASAIYMQLKAQNGLINLNQLTSKLYDGYYNGNMTVDVRGNTPIITTNNELKSIQLEPLTHDLVNITKLQVSGAGNINIHLIMRGNSERAFINSLNGQGGLSLTNGAIKGINIPYYVNAVKAIRNKTTPPKMTGPNQTSFGNTKGTFTITNGLIRNNDLLVDAPTFRANGSGTANLVSQYLDYQFTVQPMEPDAHKPQGDAFTFPVRGNFASIDMQSIISDIIKEQLSAQVKKQLQNKVTNELQKRLGDEAGKAVGDKLNSVLQQFLQ